MPIVTEDSQPTRHRAPWWVLGFVVVALLPVGLIAWSFAKPVYLPLGDRDLVMGTTGSNGPMRHGFIPRFEGPRTWVYLIDLPTGGHYAVGMIAQPSR